MKLMQDSTYWIILRIMALLVLFVSAFLFPWWVTFFLGGVGIFVFKRYVEFIVIMILLDALYSSLGGSNALFFGLFYSALGVGVYFVASLLKRSIVWYHW